MSRRRPLPYEVQHFLPTLGYRDAVGNHTRSLAAALARAGFPGRVWVESAHREVARGTRGYARYPPRRPKGSVRLLAYQSSTGSEGMVEFLLGRPEPKMIWYHNITPHRFYVPYELAVAMKLAHGREELRLLASNVDVAVADSTFNALELQALGIGDVRVVPPYVAPHIHSEPDRALAARLAASKKGPDILFVGRFSPNKGHLHLLRALRALLAGASAPPRLFLVGVAGPPAYMAVLRKALERWGLEEHVSLTGSVSDEQLAAYYRTADVYLSASEHEGYGLPLIEAMRWGVPVVAYDAAAVGETLGGAGLLVSTLDPSVLAETVWRLTQDGSLRHSVLGSQRRRVAEIEAIPRDELNVMAVMAALGVDAGADADTGAGAAV